MHEGLVSIKVISMVDLKPHRTLNEFRNKNGLKEIFLTYVHGIMNIIFAWNYLIVYDYFT